MLNPIGQPPKPRYLIIQSDVLDRIIKGEWVPGQRIPAERTLAKSYQASVGTVRRALELLVNQGYLRRTQGQGTFVNQAVEHYDTLKYFRLAADFRDVVHPLFIRCLEKPHLVVFPEAAEALELPRDRKLFKIVRTFNLGGKPVVYVITYLRPDLYPDFDRISPQTIEELALYVLLEAKYGTPTTASRERFSAQPADPEIAEFLELAPGAPILKIMLQAITSHQTPYAYQVAYCNTSKRQIYRD